MTQSNILLREIELFLSRSKVRESRLGRAALGDPSFVRELRSGRTVRGHTEAKVRAYMEAQTTEAGNGQ